MVCMIGVGYSDELLATLRSAGSVGWVRKSKRLVWESGLLSRGAWWLWCVVCCVCECAGV